MLSEHCVQAGQRLRRCHNKFLVEGEISSVLVPLGLEFCRCIKKCGLRLRAEHCISQFVTADSAAASAALSSALKPRRSQGASQKSCQYARAARRRTAASRSTTRQRDPKKMPRTRAQRRHALATALDGDSVSYILSFLPKLGVVPGRLYTLSGSGTQHTRGGLSLKAVLAPRRRRLIKCPDDIPLLENAVAAAREGDVVLLTESVELQAPIVAPPFH